MKKIIFSVLALVVVLLAGLWWPYPVQATVDIDVSALDDKTQGVIAGAKHQMGKTLFYDPAYVKLSYPNGDIPLVKGGVHRRCYSSIAQC